MGGRDSYTRFKVWAPRARRIGSMVAASLAHVLHLYPKSNRATLVSIAGPSAPPAYILPTKGGWFGRLGGWPSISRECKSIPQSGRLATRYCRGTIHEKRYNLPDPGVHQTPLGLMYCSHLELLRAFFCTEAISLMFVLDAKRFGLKSYWMPSVSVL